MSKIKLVIFEVCDRCYSVGIVDPDCICSYGKYKTIKLEFEVCNCCKNLINDGQPAETDFNKRQIKILKS